MADMAIRAQTRHLLISLALKRQKRGTGSSAEFLHTRTVQMQFPDLTTPLNGLQWAVVGAAATRLYMPERMTNDLDILVQASDSAAVRERLRQAGAAYQSEWSIGGSAWKLAYGFPLDVIESGEAWVQPALQEAQTNRGNDGFPVVPLPYLVLMKFQASRVQDLADISRMLGQADADSLAKVRTAFNQWQPDGIEDLESLILLSQLELE